ncbi:hypothetical protein LJC27_04935 [Christensenellaceae bacterium OttesenSCG-928-M15]|nr:hypothetical protein [Christensenellaceae bacterium OttesenSCG-928-M15]
MGRNITNADCKLYHTEYCDMLNMQSCAACFVQSKSNEEAVVADLKVLKELLPEEGVHTLFETEECQLCKGEQRGERAYYGMLDLGHPEPKREKRSALGIKVNTKTGSMVPVQVSTCKKCRNRILMLEYLPILLPLAIGLVTLLLLLIPDISDGMERYNMLMPFAVFAVLILLAMVIAALLKRSLRRQYKKEMHLDFFEIPLLNKLKEMGWIPLTTSGTEVRMVFTKKRMSQGVGTGTPGDALKDREYEG